MRDVLFRLFAGLLLLPATTVAWSVASVGSRLATRRSTSLFMSTVPLPPPLFPEFNRPPENHQTENDVAPSKDESSSTDDSNSAAPASLAWNRRQVLALASSGVAAAAAATVTSRFWSRPLRRHENAWPLSRSSPLPPRVEMETLLPSLTVADETTPTPPPSATDWSQLSTTSALGWPHGPSVSPLPSANAATPSLSDLERALQEQSKRRVIDPRTHG
jgi:hypothetical protein